MNNLGLVDTTKKLTKNKFNWFERKCEPTSQIKYRTKNIIPPIRANSTATVL